MFTVSFDSVWQSYRCVRRPASVLPAAALYVIAFVVACFAKTGALLAAEVPAAKPADAAHAQRPSITAEQRKFFVEKVQPILVGRCVKCHGGEDKVASEFYITSRAAVLRGGELGPAVALDDPMASQLLTAVRYEELEMPPSGKLPAAEIAVLERWVRDGLPWPPEMEKEPAHVVERKPAGVTEEDRKYWAYQPIVEPAVPAANDSAWVRTPVDAFILNKLEAAGIAPTTFATPRSLIRRATYDLTGLPPSPEEVAAFEREVGRGFELAASAAEKAAAEKAYVALIDRLLASPHYGEKWGRHWLDLVRYAETHGYERDSAKPAAWRYRDYVVSSFNQDKPYDRFLREQLAGDQLPQITPETLAATGYYRLGTWDDEPADRDLARYEVLDGVVSTTSSVVLGMSVGCARCHDHKKDPIAQRDYYKLLACFRDITDMNSQNLRRFATEAEQAAHRKLAAEKEAREAGWYGELYAMQRKFLNEASAHGVVTDGVQGDDLAELRYKLYRDTWKTLPNFRALKIEEEGAVTGPPLVSLGVASRMEAIGLVFEGKLKVPRAGSYKFDGVARAGLRLLVDGRTVLDAPDNGFHEVTNSIELPAGFLSFRLEYFNATQQPKLSLVWSGPDFRLRPLSADPATKSPGEKDIEWAYTTKPPGKGWQQEKFDDSRWERGRGGFGVRGTPGAKVGTVWKTKDIYLRRPLELKAVPKRFTFDLHHDEDVEIFLNGERVFAEQGHLREYRRIGLGPEATSALHVGTNVIAVHCRQTGGGQFVDVRPTDATQTLDDVIRQHGTTVLGKAESERYLDVLTKLTESRAAPLPPPGTDIMAVETRTPPPTHVLLRGLPQAEGDLVTAGVPDVLVPAGYQLPLSAPGDAKGTPAPSARVALVDWLVAADNPATARVLANRLWQYHFGRGLVGSANDFGKLGEMPTHPELLDWLAADLVRGEWRLKRVHRLLMTSSTYRLSSTATEAGLARDPGNHLRWRFDMRRLAAEEVRDSILAATGSLDLRLGGPSVYPPIPQEVLAGQSRPGLGWPTSKGPDANRRSLYVHVKRSLQLPIMAVFDQADTDSSCAARYTTTVPTQALGMLNGEFIHEQAAALAVRLEKEHPGDRPAQVRRATELTTQRTPTSAELAADVKFLEATQKEDQLSYAEALELYCLMALNTNELFYLD